MHELPTLKPSSLLPLQLLSAPSHVSAVAADMLPPGFTLHMAVPIRVHSIAPVASAQTPVVPMHEPPTLKPSSITPLQLLSAASHVSAVTAGVLPSGSTLQMVAPGPSHSIAPTVAAQTPSVPMQAAPMLKPSSVVPLQLLSSPSQVSAVTAGMLPPGSTLQMVPANPLHCNTPVAAAQTPVVPLQDAPTLNPLSFVPLQSLSRPSQSSATGIPATASQVDTPMPVHTRTLVTAHCPTPTEQAVPKSAQMGTCTSTTQLRVMLALLVTFTSTVCEPVCMSVGLQLKVTEAPDATVDPAAGESVAPGGRPTTPTVSVPVPVRVIVWEPLAPGRMVRLASLAQLGTATLGPMISTMRSTAVLLVWPACTDSMMKCITYLSPSSAATAPARFHWKSQLLPVVPVMTGSFPPTVGMGSVMPVSAANAKRQVMVSPSGSNMLNEKFSSWPRCIWMMGSAPVVGPPVLPPPTATLASTR